MANPLQPPWKQQHYVGNASEKLCSGNAWEGYESMAKNHGTFQSRHAISTGEGPIETLKKRILKDESNDVSIVVGQKWFLLELPYWTVGMNTFWYFARESDGNERWCRWCSSKTFWSWRNCQDPDVSCCPLWHLKLRQTCLTAELLAHRFWDHVGTFSGLQIPTT